MNMTTTSGTMYAMLPPHGGGPAPTLLLLAMAAADTLTAEPYYRVGTLLHARGWNVISLDLPCHGADRRAGEAPELEGWAARLTGGEDIVADFQERVNDVVAHLVAAGIADSARIAAAGTSRGGFMAFHAAAGNARIRAVAAFAPVTDLAALNEFSGLAASRLVRRLALVNNVNELADRAAWITIGNADDRVDTDRAIAFSQALVREAARRGLPPRVDLHLLSAPGHSSFPDWHDAAAAWLHAAL